MWTPARARDGPPPDRTGPRRTPGALAHGVPRAHRFTRMGAERSGSRLGQGAAPAPTLGTGDATALVLGIVIGAGIFRAPPVVAASAGSSEATIAAWALGGVVSLAGAMCYAKLAATYPSAGGDYHF